MTEHRPRDVALQQLLRFVAELRPSVTPGRAAAEGRGAAAAEGLGCDAAVTDGRDRAATEGLWRDRAAAERHQGM